MRRRRSLDDAVRGKVGGVEPIVRVVSVVAGPVPRRCRVRREGLADMAVGSGMEAGVEEASVRSAVSSVE